MKKNRLIYLAFPFLGLFLGGYGFVFCVSATIVGFGLRALAEWLRAKKSGPKWWAYAALAPVAVPLALTVREEAIGGFLWQLGAALMLLRAVSYVFGWLAGGAFEKEDTHEA